LYFRILSRTSLLPGKEFDTLRETIQGVGKLSNVRHVAESRLFVFGAGLLEFHPLRASRT
jgi:hypothetical protein